jgi:hypothetical protein
MHRVLTEGGEDKCSMFLFDWIATALPTTINDIETREWILDQMVLMGEWILIKVCYCYQQNGIGQRFRRGRGDYYEVENKGIQY